MTQTTIKLLIILAAFSDIKAQTDSTTFRQHILIIQGFKIILNADSVKHPEVKDALNVLTVKLTELTKIFNSKQLLIIRQTPIWIEWEILKSGSMWYHKSGEWIVANNYPLEKTKCVEINNIKNFLSWQKLNQPYMVLHEFAHAYHDNVLGSNNPEILAAYKNAVESKKYDSVSFSLGGKKRAYALNNADEYFAELTEAYLGQNDYYPYNRTQLKDFDPVGYKLMEKTWG